MMFDCTLLIPERNQESFITNLERDLNRPFQAEFNCLHFLINIITSALLFSKYLPVTTLILYE